MPPTARAHPLVVLALATLAVSTVRAYSSASSTTTGTLKLLVSYCPTAFSGAAAIVTVDASTGAFSVDGTFKWPESLIEGCVADYTPLYYYEASTNLLWIDFSEDLGVIASVDLSSAALGPQFHIKDEFFVGFESFDMTSSSSFIGISGTVTQNGLCNDGCMQIGNLATSGTYKATANILFKETSDDTHLYDASAGIYYGQFGYQLNTPRCAPTDSGVCLLAIDASTGNVTSAIYTEYEIYGFGRNINSDGTVLTWMNGFGPLCKDPYNDFLFANLDLATAVATPIACISHNTTIDTDEWVGTFSLDDTLYATGSGNSYGDGAQLVVFDVAGARTALETDLAGLPQALKAWQNLIFVWAVQFV